MTAFRTPLPQVHRLESGNSCSLKLLPAGSGVSGEVNSEGKVELVEFGGVFVAADPDAIVGAVDADGLGVLDGRDVVGGEEVKSVGGEKEEFAGVGVGDPEPIL